MEGQGHWRWSLKCHQWTSDKRENYWRNQRKNKRVQRLYWSCRNARI